MKQLICEMCGSADLLKTDGVFVCQNCGCKYSVEEAKKMMVEGVVQVEGTVKVDNTAQVKNYLEMAKHARQADNEQEAESYCNKAIEIDPTCYKAWLIKGSAAGWQSTGKRNRIGEAIECFNKAVDNAPAEEADGVKGQIANEISELSLATIQMHCNSFAKVPNTDFANDIVASALSAKLNILKLLLKCGVAPIEFQTQAASSIASAATNAWNNQVWPEYNNEQHVSKFEWEQFIERGNACIALWKSAIEMSDNDDKEDIQRYKNCIAVTECLISSHSVKYTECGYVPEWSLSDSAKLARRKHIEEWSKEIAIIEKKLLATPEIIELQKKMDEATKSEEFKHYISNRIEWTRLSNKVFASAKKKAELFSKVNQFQKSETWFQLEKWNEEAKERGMTSFKIRLEGSIEGDIINILSVWFGTDKNSLHNTFLKHGEISNLQLLQAYCCARILDSYGIAYSHQ